MAITLKYPPRRIKLDHRHPTRKWFKCQRSITIIISMEWVIIIIVEIWFTLAALLYCHRILSMEVYQTLLAHHPKRPKNQVILIKNKILSDRVKIHLIKCFKPQVSIALRNIGLVIENLAIQRERRINKTLHSRI